jgi:hypothetical protein
METLKTKNRVTSTFLIKLLKNESLLWSLVFRIQFIIYSFIKGTTKALFCFMLIFTKEYWNLVSFLTFKNRKYRTRTSNRIVHESKKPINNRTRRLFSINRLIPLIRITCNAWRLMCIYYCHLCRKFSFLQ